MGIKVALTGGNGHMGKAVVEMLAQSESVEELRLLLLDDNKSHRFARKLAGRARCRCVFVYGDIADLQVCSEAVRGSDYVVHMAAVIPPASDKNPEASYRCNWLGTKNITDAVRAQEKQPALIHCSTVALYGHRNYLHPWGRVGDPLVISPFDNYALHKLMAERYVLDADLDKWAVLRQTGILYKDLLFCNLNDGLMFHTCLNVPLEWVTDTDSGRLIKNIIESDLQGRNKDFWRKCYNIGGGEGNRNTGYETFDTCFSRLGLDTKKVLSPAWHSIRNFHGVWFEDSSVLEEKFAFTRERADEYWEKIFAKKPLFKMARFLPEKLVSGLFIRRLLSDYNAPSRWIRDKEKGLIKAYFGSTLNVNCLADDWKDYPLLAEGKVSDGDIDYDAMRDPANIDAFGYRLSHGYDESKPDCELGIEDMRQAAKFRGGECLSDHMEKGDLYTKLLWRCHDGHEFYASPYTVIKAGHWCKECLEPGVWNFDIQAVYSPFIAQVWYDTHARGERYVYYYDEQGKATYKVAKEV